MNDLISKTEALIKIRGCYQSLPLFKKNRKDWQEKYEGYIKAYEIIQDLPTVEPKTGHWYIDAESDVRCTACKTKCLRDDIGINILSNYCPNCGAKM